jgi:hypothetical protein
VARVWGVDECVLKKGEAKEEKKEAKAKEKRWWSSGEGTAKNGRSDRSCVSQCASTPFFSRSEECQRERESIQPGNA